MKRVVLMVMILSMVLCLFAGCKVQQEEGASLGEFVQDDIVEDDDVGNEQPSGNQPQQNQTPSTDSADQEDQNSSKDDEPDPSEPNSGKEDETPDQKEPEQKEPAKDEEPKEDQSDEPVDPDAKGSGWYKVASYNIKSMYYDPKTGQTGSDMREETVRIIREIDADIVGLQEVDINNSRSFNVDQPKWLAEQLGYEYYYFTQTVDKGDGEYGHAILSRFPIKDINEVEFKAQNNELRKYTRVILEIDGQEVVYINTHFCTQEKRADGTRDSSIGQSQFSEVGSIFQNEKSPAVMTGDFNLPIQTQLKLFDRAKMTSMNGGKTQTKLHEMISIDNIYVNSMLDYYVDEDGMSVFVGQETSSDHDPLWSYFKFK